MSPDSLTVLVPLEPRVFRLAKMPLVPILFLSHLDSSGENIGWLAGWLDAWVEDPWHSYSYARGRDENERHTITYSFFLTESSGSLTCSV